MAQGDIFGVSAVRIDLRITDPTAETKSEEIVTWEDDSPRFIVSLTHDLQGGGKANTLVLNLYHHMDPYYNQNDERFFKNIINEDAFGLKDDDPSYLMTLLSRGLQEIEVRYGYAQPEDDSYMTQWYKLYISDVTSTYNTSGVSYTVNASSTPTNEISSGNNTIDWYEQCGGNVVRLIELILGNEYDIDWSRCNGIEPQPIEPGEDQTEDDIKSIFLQTESTSYAFLSNFLGQWAYYESPTTVQCTIQDPADETVKNTKTCIVRYTGWGFSTDSVINDNESSLPKAYIQYSYKQYISAEGEDEGEVVKVETCDPYNGSEGLGSLFFNAHPATGAFDFMSNESISYSSFSQIFQDSGFEMTGEMINELQKQGSYMRSEVIEMNIELPIMAGLASAYSLQQKSSVNSSGEEVPVANATEATTETVISKQLAMIRDTSSYKKIALNFPASGTITIPGLYSAVPVLSRFNLFVFIANKLDILSGIYQVLSQSDSIQNGQFLTTLTVMKVKSFTGDDAYGLEDLASNTGLGYDTSNITTTVTTGGTT